jgi:molecular chaperone GrpE
VTVTVSTETDSQTPNSSAPNANEPAPAAEAKTSTSAPDAPANDGPAPDGPELEIKALKERLLRMAADFDNFRKRTRRDIADAQHRVQEELLRSLLPTFDNLERAVTHAGSAADVKALSDGIKLVLRQFQDTLGGLGIERVTTIGKPFDPAEHEAVQHVQSTEVPPGAVVTELQAGYRWQGRLMRPALVVVAKAGSPSSPPDAPKS